jgi:predicted nucleic acid-binding Zn ribbon protein|tara:strand:+ start:800 stop:976 length:177 start_codon:yes stop_codon:yes gene_type:complete
MIDKLCPICKTAIEETEKNSIECKSCKAILSDDMQWQSQFGYEWIKELKEAQDAQSKL